MKIVDVIRRVDDMYPNNYTEEEKLRWCDEASAEVMQEIKKVYQQLSCRIFPDGFVELPQGVSIEQVKYAFLNGRRLAKTEFMRRFHVCPFGICDRERLPEHGAEVTVVFLPEPKPIRRFTIRAKCDLIPDKWEDDCEEPFGDGFAKTQEGLLTVCCPDIEVGDNLEIVQAPEETEPDWSTAKTYYVLGFDFEGTHVACDSEIVEQTEQTFAIRRKILDQTVVPSPYDKLYIEYVLAQITYFQHDYDEYNIHLNNYYDIYDAYAKWYKSRNPMDDMARLHNYF